MEEVKKDSHPGYDYYSLPLPPDLEIEASHDKTVTAAFYLYNREAKRELKVYNKKKILPFCPVPTYL